MENMVSSATSSSHRTARDRRFLLPPVSAANDHPSYYSQGVVRRVVLHAGTELGGSLFARPSGRHHHHPAVGRSKIVKYKSSGAAADSCRPRLRLACQQQGRDHPGILQRRMELLRLHCQGLGLRPDYFDGHPEDIDVSTSDHYPQCSGTTLRQEGCSLLVKWPLGEWVIDRGRRGTAHDVPAACAGVLLRDQIEQVQ